MRRLYKGIYTSENTTERAQALSVYEKLASAHPEYRRVVSEVAGANTQEQEIDVLLKWYNILTHSHDGTETPQHHDTKHMQDYLFSYTPKQERGLHNTEYAGGLDESGEHQSIGISVYGTTFRRLYDEVINLVAYVHYNIAPIRPNPNVVPMSACDEYELKRAEYMQVVDNS